ncbi:MAG: response regulator [Nitrospirae bacterium]|nr:MAG: response regulator [Nitrospirota bacterium]
MTSHQPIPSSRIRTAAFFGGCSSRGGVLIVEDDESCRKTVASVLERAGYTVTEAADGESAIALARSGENPLLLDVVVVDMGLPHLTGGEVIHFFQCQFPHVQICILTGHPEINAAVAFLQAGGVDYMVKPVTSDRLLDAIAQAMVRRVSCLE